jgi:hypothetical protein
MQALEAAARFAPNGVGREHHHPENTFIPTEAAFRFTLSLEVPTRDLRFFSLPFFSL